MSPRWYYLSHWKASPSADDRQQSIRLTSDLHVHLLCGVHGPHLKPFIFSYTYAWYNKKIRDAPDLIQEHILSEN